MQYQTVSGAQTYNCGTEKQAINSLSSNDIFHRIGITGTRSHTYKLLCSFPSLMILMIRSEP